jgi:hypothetical protein
LVIPSIQTRRRKRVGGFAASTAGLLGYLILADPGWNLSAAYLIAASLATAMALMLMKESRCA